jgi:hypothetical protein
MDWSRVRFTEHMVEAAEVVGECQVAFDFEGREQTCYEVKVLRMLRGASAAPYVAVAANRADPGGFRPVGEGDTGEAAVEACLREAGVYHRRRARQAPG